MKNKLWGLVATLMIVLPVFAGLVGEKSVFAAGEDKKSTQTVTIHKRQYDNLPGNKPNSGDQVDFGSKPLAGVVFTTYDVTEDYWKAYDETTGSDAEKTAAAQTEILNVNYKIPASSSVNTFPKTDSEGEATQELAKKSLDEKKQMRNAIYLFKETTSPAGVVQSKSEPFILDLPVYNEADYTGTNGAANEEKKVVHVYPKNLVKTLELGFTKYGVENGKESSLAGAKFILKNKAGMYFNTDTNVFDLTEAAAQEKPLTSDAKGKVSVSGLVLEPGDYEFYEIDSDVSSNGKQAVDSEVLYHYGKNPIVVAHVSTDMEVTYTYYDIDGNKLEGETEDISAYNYKVPEPTKDAEDHDVDGDQVFEFTITQLIPQDIADYTEFKLIDNYDPALYLLNADPTAEIKGNIKLDDAAASDLVTEVTTADNQFTVNFDLDKIKENAGKTISFAVQMAVKPDTKLGTDINNEITFDNNFHPESDQDAVKTFGKKFIKKDADTEKTLAAAEFNVLNPEGKILGTKEGKQVWGTRDEEGFTATVLTSDEKGEFAISGLAKTDADGKDITYQLKEIKAPEGYVLLNDPIDFVADDQTAALVVSNKHKGSLPSTGGMGIVAFVAVGIAAIGGAVLYFTKGRKQIEG